MVIHLRYFGVLTPKLSTESQKIELPPGATIEHLVEVVSEMIEDSTSELMKKATFLVNKMGAKKDTILNDDDEVIILYAIGGG